MGLYACPTYFHGTGSISQAFILNGLQSMNAMQTGVLLLQLYMDPKPIGAYTMHTLVRL